MQATLIALVENTLAAINRIVSVLRGRNFGVVSVTTGRTGNPGIACVTVVIDANLTRPARVAACLEKLYEVLRVEELQPSAQAVHRELALVKMAATPATERMLSALDSSTGARVADRSHSTVIVELVGEPSEIDHFIESMSPSEIIDVARIGPVAMARGSHAGVDPKTG